MSIEIRNLAKSFRAGPVFSGLSLKVEPGEILALFGPSGVGKTVLLRLIAGVIEPDRGEIILNGQNMEGVEPEGRGVGMAFQNFALFPHMDAFANIAAPLEARGQGKAALSEVVGRVAKLLKIDHVLAHKPKELSNGQKQRTALARALSAEPSVLLLDDPLRNVDAKLRFEMRLELPRLLRARKAAVIYVTQDYKEAMALGDRIAVMGAGGLAQIGTPEDIYRRPAAAGIARLFGDPAINLIGVEVHSGRAGLDLKLSGRAVPVDSAYKWLAQRKCILGLRPEALRFVEQGMPGAFPVTVEAQTPLNEKTVTLARLSEGAEILASRPAGMVAPDHGLAYLAFDPEAALFFDPETGALLPPGGPKA